MPRSLPLLIWSVRRMSSPTFGFKRRFLHESETYGEIETGETTLSFAAHELADGNVPGGHCSRQ
jgi:lactoylglutathione lyase